MPKLLPADKKEYSVAKPLEKEAMVRYAIDRMTSGLKTGQITSELMEKFRVTETNALKVINDCKDGIKNQMQIRVPFILSIHIERYEYLYKKFEVIGRTDLINKCLQQKEELLNLKNALSERLSEDFNRKDIENRFNFNKLPKDKQQRVKTLVAKGLINND